MRTFLRFFVFNLHFREEYIAQLRVAFGLCRMCLLRAVLFSENFCFLVCKSIKLVLFVQMFFGRAVVFF